MPAIYRARGSLDDAADTVQRIEKGDVSPSEEETLFKPSIGIPVDVSPNFLCCS